MQSDRLFIGDMSKRTDVPVKTIRYYEDFGLLDKSRFEEKYFLHKVA